MPRRGPKEAPDPEVVDDLRDDAPVTVAEVDAVESFLAAALQDLFGPPKPETEGEAA